MNDFIGFSWIGKTRDRASMQLVSAEIVRPENRSFVLLASTLTRFYPEFHVLAHSTGAATCAAFGQPGPVTLTMDKKTA
jgi:hypothetical protein